MAIIGHKPVDFDACSVFNHHRLLQPNGYTPPAEAAANCGRQLANQNSPWRPDINQASSAKTRAVQWSPESARQNFYAPGLTVSLVQRR